MEPWSDATGGQVRNLLFQGVGSYVPYFTSRVPLVVSFDPAQKAVIRSFNAGRTYSELQKEAFAVGEASRAAHATRTDESHNGGNDQLAFEAALGEERYCARPIEPVWQAMPSQ